MRRFLIIISVCVAASVCASATLKTNANEAHIHQGCYEAELICCESDSAIAMGSSWVVVSDDCKKCIMNDTTRKCGKCGGFMASVPKTSSVDGSYIKSDYKCNDCGHRITYKNK